MKLMIHAVPLLVAFAAVPMAMADTLLIERAQQQASEVLPARGQTMQQVQARYGAPQEQLQARGGQKQQWPTINRWVYPAFTVYFEKQRVIDVVANQASPEEIGPKPATR